MPEADTRLRTVTDRYANGCSRNDCPMSLAGHHAERDEYGGEATVFSRTTLTAEAFEIPIEE